MADSDNVPRDKNVHIDNVTHDPNRNSRDLTETDNRDIEKNSETPSRVTQFFSLMDSLRRLILSAVVLTALALGISVIAKATLNRSILIEPISVPKELADRGITAEAAAHFIVDEMVILAGSANTLKRLDAVGTSGPEFAKPKIEVPGTGISIDTVVYYLRDFLGRSDTKVSGEIIIDKTKVDPTLEKSKKDAALEREDQNLLPKFNLRLRIANKGFVYVEAESTDDLRVLFKRAGFPLLEQISPYIAGAAYLEKKDFIPAIQMAEIELRTGLDENQMWASNLLGSIAREQGRTDSAIAQFTKMTERFPYFPMGWYNLGHVLHNTKNYQDSIHASLAGTQIDPDSRRRAIGYNNAGSAFDQMQKKNIPFNRQDKNADGIFLALRKIVKDEVSLAALSNGRVPTSDLAAHLFRGATEADPLFAPAYLGLGRIERERRNFVEATALFEKSIAAKPTKASGYSDMGDLYISQRDWDNAAKFFRKATNLDPESFLDHHNLGRALGGLGKYEEAATEFKTALKINPKFARSHLRWAQTLAEKASDEAADAAESTRKLAMEHLKAALKLSDDDRGLLAQVAATYEKLGLLEEAAAAYGRIDEKN